jgi:hypothetical protein
VRLLLAAVLLLWATVASASPTASCVVTPAYRTGTTITAPAYVHVDCSGTTDSDTDVRPFHDLRFDISFGDTGSSGQGTWGYGWLGDPRGSEAAPVAAHVYDEAGTFTITATVTGQDGSASEWSQNITVESEDSGWTSADTRCVSTSGTFTGCPGGSSEVTSSDFDAQMQTGSGKRTLYRCGESFTADAQNTLTNSETNGSLVGGYGSCGGNPVLVDVTYTSSYITANLSGWRFRDIRFTHSGAGDSEGVFSSVGGDADRFLALRIDTLAVGGCAAANTTVTSSATNTLFALVDYNCEMTKTTTGSWNNGFYSIENGAIVGSRFYANSTDSLGQRISHSTHSIWAHNTYHFEGASNSLTIQFRGVDPASGRSDQYGVIRDMRIHDEGDETLRTLVLSAGGAGLKTDYLLESIFATYETSKSLITMFAIDVGDVTIRNNIWDIRGLGAQSTNNSIVYIDTTIAGDDPSNISAYNNTAIRDGSTANTLRSVDSSGGTGHRSRNNLMHDLVDTDNTLVGGTSGLTSSNNVHTNDGEEGCPFAGSDDACTLTASSLTMDADEFRIRSSGGGRASVVDTGFTFPDTGTASRRDHVFVDAYMNCRDPNMGGGDGTWDVGAHEYGAVACSDAGANPSLNGVSGSGFRLSMFK